MTMPNQRDFALFVDVMGVQRELTRADAPSDVIIRKCRETFEQFHQDLFDIINMSFPMMSARGRIAEPSFVAEFSDAAYIVAPSFATVAAAGILLMRKALRHRYPLRGGLGSGNFSHETSGVRTTRLGQVWSTSSFFGSAVVTAYQAERTAALGLRVFVHTSASDAAANDPMALALAEGEATESSTHELRLWRDMEVEAAVGHLIELKDAQQLSDRARAHYDTTQTAYGRFAAISDELPFITPALWLF
jgi:hypothetical protein